MADNSKDYILSILAQLQGQQTVTTALTGIATSAQQLGITVDESGKKAQSFADVLDKATSRALIVAPIWLVLRQAMMLVLDTMKLLITANLDLETSMANIQTSLRGSAESVQLQSNAIKELLVSTRSPVGVKELGTAYVELQKVLQDTATSMAGFKATETLMVATGLSAKEAGSLMAKTFLEIGSSMDASLSSAEKFQRIADILTFTTKTQGVEVKGLADSYSKLAPFLTGTSDKFEDVITLLGFLSTHFIEGGRAGQSLSTELVNLQKNAKTLADVFQVQLNPNNTTSIIETFKQIEDKIKSTGKLSEEQSLAISKIFGGARTSAPAREILTNLDDLIKALDDAKEHASGFAEKTKGIVENTTVLQFRELLKILGDLSTTFAGTFFSSESLATGLKHINDWLLAMRPTVEGVGVGMSYLYEQVSRSIAPWKDLLFLDFKKFGNEPGLRGFTAFVDEYLKSQAQMVEAEKKRNAPTPTTPETDKNLESVKEETMQTKELGNMLSALDIAQSRILEIKIAQLQANHANLTDEDYSLKLETLKYEQAVALLKERQKANDELSKENTSVARRDELEYIKESGALLQALGADESQILAIKLQELEINKDNLSPIAYGLELEKLRFQQVVAITKAREQEALAQANFAVEYAKADEFDRARLRRLQELRNLSTSDVLGKLNQSPFDANIIEQNLSKFSKDTQVAVGQALTAKFHLPGEPVGGLEKVPTDELKQLTGGASMFWDAWESRKQTALADFSRDFSRTVSGAFAEANPFGVLPGSQPVNNLPTERRVTIDPVEVNLKLDTSKMTGADIADAVTKAFSTELKKKANLDKIAEHTLNEYKQ